MQETELKIGSLKLPHRLILAPMCGITLLPFRQICKELGAGLVFNQMVSAKAITMGDSKSFHIMKFEKTETPVGLQLFGNDAETLAEAAKILESHQPDVIDLNLGCPAKKIVNDGGGSALLSDTEKLRTILSKMRDSIKGIFTIKMRAGWDHESRNSIDLALMAQEIGIDAVAIHGRTRSQGYSGKSDWDFIREMKANLKIPVIGNGDVESANDAYRMMEETGCDAVMTGRGAFNQPWIFENFVNKTEGEPSFERQKELILKQYEGFQNYAGPTGGIKLMRKFICAYTKGKRGGSAFRNEIIRMDDMNQIKTRLNEFFAMQIQDH